MRVSFVMFKTLNDCADFVNENIEIRKIGNEAKQANLAVGPCDFDELDREFILFLVWKSKLFLQRKHFLFQNQQ